MTTETVTETTGLDTIAELAAQLRVDSIRSSTSAGSGHPTSSMSAADLIAVLAARHLRYDWDDPHAAANDHLVFSKGHASPLLYSLFKATGVVSDEELMTGYRRFGQRLEGHPTPVLPWVDWRPVLSVRACPMAWALRSRANTSSTFLSGSGSSAATASWPRVRSGKPSTRRPTTNCPTSSSWRTSTDSGSGGRPISVGRLRSTNAASKPSVPARSSSTVTTSLRSTARFAEAENTGGDRPTVIVAKTIKGRGFLGGREQRRLAR